MKLSRSPRNRAFSLIEILVAMALFGVVMLIMVQMLDRTTLTWKQSRSTVTEFKDARVAFETITRRLSQATVNAYWGYKITGGVPTQFVRKSELHFISGPSEKLLAAGNDRSGHAIFFHAPLGHTKAKTTAGGGLTYGKLNNLLNGWGFFTEFGSDEPDRPPVLNSLFRDNGNDPPLRLRYRLMEFRQPTEQLRVYSLTLGADAPAGEAKIKSWYNGTQPYCVDWSNNYQASSLEPTPKTNWLVAENILALIILPTETVDNEPEKRASLAPDYFYDSQGYQYRTNVKGDKSRNQLPPLIDLTMIALDDSDFSRYLRQNSIKTVEQAPRLFQGLRAGTNIFKNAKSYNTDLEDLKDFLSDKDKGPGIEFRVFRATIRMREAKWSSTDPEQ